MTAARLLHRRRAARGVTAAVLALLALGTAAGEPIQPLPAAPVQDAARIELGKRLFNDTRISVNNRVSCASCHDLARGGADGQKRSAGLNGRLTDVNTPTVFNAGFNFRQAWNGRNASLEDQIDNVIRSPGEMNTTWEDVVRRLSPDQGLRKAFGVAYPEGLTGPNVRDAIASYNRSLVTPNARFDQYLRGNTGALSAQEQAGYAKFKQYGCVACHQGANVGGNMYQKFGTMGDYFAQRGNATQADLGRFLVTGQAGDRHVFKVPSLRNVALTAPYFHDGSAATLEEAVDVMFRYQLGRIASREDRDAIVRFLRTLTGDTGQRP